MNKLPIHSIENILDYSSPNNKDTAQRILTQLRLDGWHLISSPKFSEEDESKSEKYKYDPNKIIVTIKNMVDDKVFEFKQSYLLNYENNSNNLRNHLLKTLFVKIAEYLSDEGKCDI